MTLDVALVCPSCRRFWTGPPGQLPFPSPRGVVCRDEGHALGRHPERVTVAPLSERASDEVRVFWLRPEHVAEAHAHAVDVNDAADRMKLANAAQQPGRTNLETRKASFEAEVAVALYLGGLDLWNKVVGLSDKPDVGDDVEVKSARRDGNLIVPDGPHALRPIRPDWRYVLARGRFPDLWLTGWAWGREVLERPALTLRADRPNEPARRLYVTELRSIAGLRGYDQTQ